MTGQGQCELVHTAVAQLRASYVLMMGNGHWGDTMQHGFKLASQASRTGEASLSHGGFAVQVAMALIVILLLTLTSAALETFLSGDQSLSALQAAMAIN